MKNEALQRFITLKEDAEAKAAAILQHVQDHCEVMPDDVDWGTVGKLGALDAWLDVALAVITGEGQ